MTLRSVNWNCKALQRKSNLLHWGAGQARGAGRPTLVSVVVFSDHVLPLSRRLSRLP